jgi:hypothetical protein
MNDLEIFKKLSELKEKEITVCLATIIETAGSTPREPGAKMIICMDGTTYGTIRRAVRLYAAHWSPKSPRSLKSTSPTIWVPKGGMSAGENCGFLLNPFEFY